MKTFSIQTLGCKVNQYESDQIATLLRARGMIQVDSPSADLRIINTCSVTIQAASKSRQTIRRTTRLPQLSTIHYPLPTPQRTIVTGCWATSNRNDAANLSGVDAVLTHHDNVEQELSRLLDRWNEPLTTTPCEPPGRLRNDGSMISAGTSAENLAEHN